MKDKPTINFRCGHCGAQWSSKIKKAACAKCGGSLIQTLSIDEQRSLSQGNAQTRLHDLIRALNQKGSRARLRIYAESWLQSGCNGFNWSQRNPKLFEAVQRTLAGSSLVLAPAVDGCFLTWHYRHAPRSTGDAERRKADKMFADFLSESAGNLGQCADPRCDKFFEKTDPRKIYCAGQCAIRVSSRKLKLDAYHETHHAKFRRLLEVLKELSPEYTADALVDENFWKEEVIKQTANLAKPVARKKVRGFKLSAADRDRQRAISIRWLNKHLDDPASCEECAGYIAEVKKFLDPKSIERRA
jgi:hypothetical protein